MVELTRLNVPNYEEVVEVKDPSSGLHAIISIHNTLQGPAVGGCRMLPYESFDDALTDANDLAGGMTFKSLIHQCPFGGGKSSMIGDPKTLTREMLLAMGRAVERLEGRYIIAEDMNIGPDSVAIMAEETDYIAGINKDGYSGNPSPVTAKGVYLSIKACVQRALGKHTLEGVRIGVAGIGAVGSELCKLLIQDGAVVIITDTRQKVLEAFAQEHGLECTPPDQLHKLELDVYSPCGGSKMVTYALIEELQAGIICGAANVQLADPSIGAVLSDKGILYVPDVIANGGGIINISAEFQKDPHENKLIRVPYDRDIAMARAETIPKTLNTILDYAEHNNLPTNIAMEQMAKGLLASDRSTQSINPGLAKAIAALLQIRVQ